MSDNELKVLEIINKEASITQKYIADKLNISVGNVNSIIKNLTSEEYIRIEKISRKQFYKLNEKGINALENYIKTSYDKKITIPHEGYRDIKSAVILAAGQREGFEKPVGFLELGEETVIHRIINTLIRNGIDKIIIITGYKSNYYEVFKDNNCICLVKNEDYKNTGTMYSLSLAKDIINDDFILIESDMVFEERAIEEIIKEKNRNCILITEKSGLGDEVFVEIRNNFIYKLSKDIHEFNRVDGEMIGITKISIDIFNKMVEYFQTNDNPYQNYEYALLDIATTYNIGYVKINDLVWSEIDNVGHYKNLINYIYPILKEKELKKSTKEEKK